MVPSVGCDALGEVVIPADAEGGVCTGFDLLARRSSFFISSSKPSMSNDFLQQDGHVQQLQPFEP
jgi:hypothetical protein